MKIRVDFERVGRNHDVPALDFATDATDLEQVGDELATAVYEYVRRWLASRWPNVDVYPDGTVLINWGRGGRGQWREVVSAA